MTQRLYGIEEFCLYFIRSLAYIALRWKTFVFSYSIPSLSDIKMTWDERIMPLFYSILGIHYLEMFIDERLMTLVIQFWVLIAMRWLVINKSQRRYKSQEYIKFMKNDGMWWTFLFLTGAVNILSFCNIYVNYYFYKIHELIIKWFLKV